MIRTADDYTRALQAATMEREREHLVADLLVYCRSIETDLVATARRAVPTSAAGHGGLCGDLSGVHSMSPLPVLKAGCNAYLDTFAGLVPCKVLEVRAPVDRPEHFDLGHGFASVTTTTLVRVARDQGPYKKGEHVSSNALHTVPVRAIGKRKYQTTIGAYHVEHSA